MTRVLVVEDQPDLLALVQLHLQDLGLDVTAVTDGRTGCAHAETGGFDLVILDLMLPGMDGLEICRRIRRQSSYTPVLMLTAKSSESDRVLGLELGADDYLTKPFSIRELVARVRAILRRVEALSSVAAEQLILDQGDLTIEVDKRKVQLRGESLHLTAKEFDLLAHFAQHPGRVFTRAELLDQVWGYGHDGYEHTVNSHINRLRSKIETDPADPRYILTVWGVGYKFAELDGS